jgi:uncharacterized protein (DUF2267 family)
MYIMKEVVDLVKQKAGIGDDQARTAVNTVVGFLKDRLPPQLSDQIDAVLEGKDVSSLGKNLGSVFGGDKK